jgi:hypothetical protein
LPLACTELMLPLPCMFELYRCYKKGVVFK